MAYNGEGEGEQKRVVRHGVSRRVAAICSLIAQHKLSLCMRACSRMNPCEPIDKRYFIYLSGRV
eukprot:scaffold8867_cov118-Isochrysis_galbana.AAC.14